MSGIEYRPCKRCKTPLAFVRDPHGKVVPLDMRVQVYEIFTNKFGKAECGTMPTGVMAVSHFDTCPSEFQKKAVSGSSTYRSDAENKKE